MIVGSSDKVTEVATPVNVIDFVPITVPLALIVTTVLTGFTVPAAPLLTVTTALWMLDVLTSVLAAGEPENDTNAPFVADASRYAPVYEMYDPY
jgi:hypothetical protein